MKKGQKYLNGKGGVHKKEKRIKIKAKCPMCEILYEMEIYAKEAYTDGRMHRIYCDRCKKGMQR